MTNLKAQSVNTWCLLKAFIQLSFQSSIIFTPSHSSQIQFRKLDSNVSMAVISLTQYNICLDWTHPFFFHLAKSQAINRILSCIKKKLTLQEIPQRQRKPALDVSTCFGKILARKLVFFIFFKYFFTATFIFIYLFIFIYHLLVMFLSGYPLYYCFSAFMHL